MEVDIESLDFGTMCYFVGLGFNDRVVARLKAEGYTAVKASFGFVVQHVLDDAVTVTGLAGRMGVTQQAASKRVREMIDAGLLVSIPTDDARERRITLSAAGRQIVERTRALRGEVVTEMLGRAEPGEVATSRAVLIEAIKALGWTQAIRARRVKEPE